MNVIVFMICFCIFSAWLFYEQRKSQKSDEQASRDFWEREERANNTRNKDISTLPLLHVEETELPASKTDNEDIDYYVKRLHDNIKQPMMDLSSYSNTDLKLAYGVGNFKTLSEYDENYNTFLLDLTNLARAYFRAECYKEAIQTLRLAISYGSRKTTDYTWLAKSYLALDEPEQVSALITEISHSEHPRKSSVIHELQNILKSYR
jgi:hypothetical protein